MRKKKSVLWQNIPALVFGLVFALAILGGLCFLLWKVLNAKEAPKRKVIQEITVIAPPPPPPPPPPEEIPEPEVEEVVEDEIEETTPDDAPPEVASQDLGIDADGTAGGDGFGLLAKKGGRGLLAGGGFGAYMRSELQKSLMAHKRLKHLEYDAIVKVWFDEEGKVRKTELVLIEGKKDVKEQLEDFLKGFPELIKKKPLEAPENYYELGIRSLF